MAAGQITPGRRRLVVDEETLLPAGEEPRPGDYWFGAGRWWCMTPSGFIGGLSLHTVTEHREDGAITVTPSILVTTTIGGEKRAWHGYLEHGVWREV